MEEKQFEAFKGHSDNKMVVTLSDIRKLMLPSGFMEMLKNCNVGEILFHNDTMTEYKRIK